MANRYWVGGAGTWNTTSTTNWSTASGGASGASVPTAADSVFFDQAGTYTVTMTGALLCLDITVSAGTVTFATGTTPTLAVSGSMSLIAGTVWSSTGAITFNATTTGKTVTTNGTSLSGAITFNGLGGAWTLGSALTSAGAITVSGGTFDTSPGGNYSVSTTAFTISGATTKTVNLNASTVTCSASSTAAFTAGTNINLTFNAGTSQINLSGTTSGITSGGWTFYNVAFTSTTAGTKAITGINTFNNFAVTAPSTAGLAIVTFGSTQTINGTLSTTGTAGNRRVWFSAATYGLAQTLTVNSAPSLTDADFRDIYVVGTAAPISGTRVGNLRGCSGITFSTPKTVYWVTAAGGNWSGTNWAATSGGAASDSNFPLAQDTAKIENTGLNTSATVTLDAAITYFGTLDTSSRGSTSFSLSRTNAYTVYGDFISCNGVTYTGSQGFTFSGRNTQTITSAGNFSVPITVDSYGGTVQLADALNIGTSTLTVTNGTFDTKNYNVTAGALSSSNSNVRTITLGSSTLTLSGSSPITFTTSTNLTLNAGTSQITCSAIGSNFNGGGMVFSSVSFTTTSTNQVAITGANTFANLTVTAPASAGLTPYALGANQTITDTLTVAGASAVRRIFVRSDTLGTTRTLTVNSLSATDCDFRDITISGAAAGSSPTRAGDCGGNTGITFPSPKTVYWNLAGTQSWSATGWAPGTGGTPDINQFPLAQDTAVFDNSSAVTEVTGNASFNVGTFNASNRTSAMTFGFGGALNIYGNILLGTGVTTSAQGSGPILSGRGTQTITSNGVTFNNPIIVDCVTGTVQLADALTLGSTRTLTLTSGTFDAVSYNVTTGLFSITSGTLKMGSGTWTLSGTGTVWNWPAGTLYKGTANIVLSNTSTTARTFNAGGLSYNKLTIGGTTGTSTLTFNSTGQFTELASTKTVAHTIAFGTNAQTFGKWSVTGTAGNVVTVTGTATLTIAGAAVSGVDYLAMGTTALSTTSPGEFYAGANSTGTGAGITLTAAPAPRTLYWVGGTGNWNDTAHWSTSSGGASGAAIPTSLDAVNFDSASNATAYTVTVNAASLRCGSLTMAGPASGNVTWAGTNPLYIHGSVSLAATGITRTYTGAITLSSSSTGMTFTTNGNTLASAITVNGVSCGWTLGSALNIGTSNTTITNGSFDTAGYAVTSGSLLCLTSNTTSISLGATTWTSTLASSGASFSGATNLTFNAGTSTLNFNGTSPGVTAAPNGTTFYNVYFGSTAIGTATITGTNTFNNLTFAGRTTAGISNISVTADQTINGTLTLSAGTNATMRQFVQSDTLGTTRTLTCNAFSGTDVDFRDITVTGAAAPVSGTRLGDCKGNSGITFDAPKTVYRFGVSTLYSGSNSWSLTAGGAGSDNNFPLAQDTAVFIVSPGVYPASGGTVTINANYNIGTIDMSARTSNTMTLATGTNTPTIYGNWINGTGTTLTGTSTLTFAGRGAQTITSAGRTFTQQFTISSPGGSVALQDALVTNNTASNFQITAGTFDANSYNVTASASVLANASTSKTVAFGSGTWTLSAATAWNGGTPATTTVTGTGTISMTNASAKTFAGGGISYSGITLDQGGAGALTITGNNTFKNITNSYSATGATTIAMGTTTQTVTQWTGAGQVGNILTVQGTSASSPATLILSGATKPNVDYLAITGVRAYSLDTTWYAGANSTNNGSLGWYFSAGGGVTYIGLISETSTATDLLASLLIYGGIISETATATDVITTQATLNNSVAETATGTDSNTATLTLPTEISESLSISDAIAGALTQSVSFADLATITDSIISGLAYSKVILETASATDALSTVLGATGYINETATGTDSLTNTLAAAAAVYELTTGTDALTLVGTYNVVFLDTSTATDAVLNTMIMPVSLSDTATATDAVLGLNTMYSVIAETGTATDALSAQLNAAAALYEVATATDAISPIFTFNVAALNTATATDALTVIGTYNVATTASATVTDATSGAFLWNPIDDTQIANWGAIDNTQGGIWAAIDDSQIANWQNINNAQTPGWGAIDDSQNPDWTPVLP